MCLKRSLRTAPFVALLLFVSLSSMAQVTNIEFESFEGTASELGYTADDWRDGFSDYHDRLSDQTAGDPAPVGGYHIFSGTPTNIHDDGTGDQYFWGSDDLDDNGNPRTDDLGIISLNTVDVNGYNNLELTLALAEGRHDRFETDDYIQIYYAFDADTSSHPGLTTVFTQGNYTLLADFRGSALSSDLSLDTNTDGIGDGVVVLDTGAFSDYTFPITGSGSKLSLRIVMGTDGPDEEILIDNIRIGGQSNAPSVAVSITTTTDESCPGAGDGSVTATVTPGQANYTYDWSTGANTTGTSSLTDVLTNLTATTYTVTVTDGNGSTATASTTVGTTADNTAPSISVCASTPANISASASCTGTTPDLTNNVTATDNCTSSPTISQSPAAGSTLALGTTTITLTATDGSNNTATCTVNQTVVDDDAPTINMCASTPANISADASCQGTTPDLIGGITASDNCTGSPIITQSPASGAALGLGTTTITLTATDVSGNTATCTVNQTVIDDDAPTISVCASTPSNISADASCLGTTPNFTGSISASDNCTASPTITQSPASGTSLGLGTTTITLTATDGSGNTATCTVNQTVVDDTDPTISVCASTPSALTPNVNCEAMLPDFTGQVTATDNCTGSPTITQSPTGGSTITGTTTVTLTATDGSGNTATCTISQAVTDNTAPVISVCASTPSNISADANCQGTATDLTGNLTATDNCTSSPAVTQSPAAGTTLGLGTTTITLTATDNDGNTATCTVNQTVIDDSAPTITTCAASPSPLAADANCEASAPDLSGQVVSSDNCSGSVTITQSPTANSTLNVGSTTVTLTATDGAGNTATCTVNVDVTDQVAPMITCPGPQADLSAGANCMAPLPDLTGVTITSDACSTPVTLSQMPAGATMVGLGTTTVTLTATDASNNTATCTIDITVVDDSIPTIACPSTQIIAANANCQGMLGDLTLITTATDNCTTSPTLVQSPASGTMLSLGVNQVTLTATDAANNTSSCLVSVLVEDVTPPVLTCAVVTNAIPAGANCQAAVPNLAAQSSATDNCSAQTTLSQNPSAGMMVGLGNHPITIYASDDSGNVDSCIVFINVVDATSPVISCPNDVSTCQELFSFSTPTASDNCELDTVMQTAGLPSGSMFPPGANIIEFTAVDAAGNADTCQFTLTILENLNAGQDTTILVCIMESAFDLIDFVSGTNDNSGDWFDLDNSGGLVNNEQFDPGAAGNTGTYQIAYVLDNGICQSDTAIFTITVDPCIGIHERNQAVGSIQIFPNPNQGQFELQLNDLQGRTAEVILFDLTGQQIQHQNIPLTGNKQQVNINLGSQAQGLYILHVKNSYGSYHQRIIIE